VFITTVPLIKLFAWGDGEGGGGHVLRETTSRGLCGLVCPSRTSERGGEGYCVKEGGEEKGSAILKAFSAFFPITLQRKKYETKKQFTEVSPSSDIFDFKKITRKICRVRLCETLTIQPLQGMMPSAFFCYQPRGCARCPAPSSFQISCPHAKDEEEERQKQQRKQQQAPQPALFIRLAKHRHNLRRKTSSGELLARGVDSASSSPNRSLLSDTAISPRALQVRAGGQNVLQSTSQYNNYGNFLEQVNLAEQLAC